MKDAKSFKNTFPDQEDFSVKERQVRRAYLLRFEHLKRGQKFYQDKDWDKAILEYRNYLRAMIDQKGVSIRQLSPKNFDHSTELAEMLVISHVFWDLVTIYDRCVPLYHEFKICLNLYLRFTIGFKYHNANLVSFKRYTSTKQVRNKNDFNMALNTLLVSSKKCFIATLCFGSDSSITNSYRSLKPWLMKFSWGIKFIDTYYHYSPIFIDKIEDRPKLKFLLVEIFIKPSLLIGYGIQKLARHLFPSLRK